MKQVKIKYKYQIILYFSLMLIAISLGFSYVFVQKEKNIKMDMLKFQMYPYTDLIYNYITKDSVNFSGEFVENRITELSGTLPKEMRITIINPFGWVIYDNLSGENIKNENHIDRPEIQDANKKGFGSALRYSATLHSDYLYYAKKYPDLYIRTALDYKASVQPLVKSDNKYRAFIIIVFIIVIALLVYISRQIGQPVSALKEFIDKVQQGKGDYDNIRFPDNEFGELGEKIIQTFRQLENTKQYKQQLTHNVAHELKTPVTGIRGYLETLLQQENIDNEQRRFFLDRAYAQTMRLSAIITDISILNKIEEAADKFYIEKINIRQCIKEIESDLAFKLEEKNIQFTINVDENLTIEGIYLLIYSLFKNLIDNSIEHGGENIKICIENTRCDENYAYFTYYDTGKGIPEMHLDRIFERFYRVEAGRSRKSGGSGLGLSIVKNSINMHKGTISVKNRDDGGLVFKFSLALKIKS
ncbi:MAG: ATP-binding protein [Rikenellaceae bacterium]